MTRPVKNAAGKPRDEWKGTKNGVAMNPVI